MHTGLELENETELNMSYTTQSDAYAIRKSHGTLHAAIERLQGLRAVTGAAIRRQSDDVAVAGGVQGETKRGAVFYKLQPSRHATFSERDTLREEGSAWS